MIMMIIVLQCRSCGKQAYSQLNKSLNVLSYYSRLRNDLLLCVEWDVKPCIVTHFIILCVTYINY